MQFKRARRLSSERRIYQGACLLSVAFTIMSSHFRNFVPVFVGFQIHWAELPLPQGIVDPRQKSPFLFFLAHLKPDLDEDNSVVDYGFLKMRAEVEKPLVVRFLEAKLITRSTPA